ncbi:MAG: hypothetical protein B7O98_07730 [Zestosphaera tikiterensis]|uniref:Uncharacterized protein n=1 Tax=Zestosphaera tikiterensis TaxID=1973259 RepID=A0A2R7Y4T6_9CREN|nr:MAG: hypothetical protein B7O98_07730 [Zestosphaera tikiterensis]
MTPWYGPFKWVTYGGGSFFLEGVEVSAALVREVFVSNNGFMYVFLSVEDDRFKHLLLKDGVPPGYF